MRKFTVEVPHALAPDEVKSRLERARAKLEEEYGATCTWEGDKVMRVHRKGLDGRVHLEADKLRVDVELALLLAPMGGKLRDGIAKRLGDLMQPKA